MKPLKKAIKERDFEGVKHHIQHLYGVQYRDTVVRSVNGNKWDIHILDDLCEGDPQNPQPSYTTIWLCEFPWGYFGHPAYYDVWREDALLLPAPNYSARKKQAITDAVTYIEDWQKVLAEHRGEYAN